MVQAKNIIFILSSLLLIGACSKEITFNGDKNTESAPGRDNYVRLALSDGGSLDSDSTKTQMQGVRVVWENGDKILVNGEIYTVAKEGDNAYVKVKASQHYDAYYPANLWIDGVLYVQPSQFYRSSGFAPMSNPMYASADGTVTSLYFHHLMGILKLKIKGKGTVASICIEDNEDKVVCGCYSHEENVISPVAGTVGFPSVTLNCKTSSNGGVALTEGGRDFYIVLPARTYSKGLTINIELVDGHSMMLKSAVPRTIRMGDVLSTPDIQFSYDSAQIYEYHFDNLVLGGDPVGRRNGFKADTSSSLTGFEYLTQITDDVAEDGTVDFSTANKNKDFSGLGKPFAYTRNIQDMVKVHRTRECHGYLSCGTGHTATASFKLPALSNLESGLFTVEYSFKMAFQEGHKPQYGIQLLHTTSTPGKVLELYVDGVNVTGRMDDSMRWLSTLSSSGPFLKDVTNTEERVLVRPDDFNNDSQWHDVRLIMGVANSKTVLQIEPLGSSPDQPFYIDDIKATKIDYPYGLSHVTFREPTVTSYAWDAGYALMPTMLVNPFTSSAMNALSTYSGHYNIKRVDVTVSANLLFSSAGFAIQSLDDNDWTYFDSKVASIKKSLDSLGIKVWSIHLPYTNLKEGGVEDESAFEWCETNDEKREAAVNRLKVIMKHLAPFAPQNWMIHTTYHHNWSFDGYTSTGIWMWEKKTYYRDCGVESFKSLVAYANTLKYSDGTSGFFTIENIANTGTTSEAIAAKLDNLIWFCDQCPGLGICLDTGHAVVNGINAGDGDFTTLITTLCEKGYLKHLHIHGNYVGNNKDCHLMPGYTPGLFVSSEFSTTDTIDWGKLYKALIDNGYRGAFTYEYASPEYGGDFRDCIANYPNIVNNYLNVVLPAYINN